MSSRQYFHIKWAWHSKHHDIQAIIKWFSFHNLPTPKMYFEYSPTIDDLKEGPPSTRFLIIIFWQLFLAIILRAFLPEKKKLRASLYRGGILSDVVTEFLSCM